MGLKTNFSQQLKEFNNFWDLFFIYGFNGVFLYFLIHLLIVIRKDEIVLSKILIIYLLGGVIGLFLFVFFLGIVTISKLKKSRIEYKLGLSWYAMLAFVGGFTIVSFTGFLIIILNNWLIN